VKVQYEKYFNKKMTEISDLYSIAESDEKKRYKYMSHEETGDFDKRVLDMLQNTNYKEIQICEEKRFSETFGKGERVYITKIYEKDKPIFDNCGYTQAVAIMSYDEVKEFKKSLETESNVKIIFHCL